MKHWMFRCRDVSRMVSESMDRELPWQKRMGIRLHLMMCRLCTRHKKQLEMIRVLMGRYSRALEESGSLSLSLPSEEKGRIKELLQNSLNSPPSGQQ